MKKIQENRYGKFKIDDELFAEAAELVMTVMSKCIIHRAEHRYDTRSVEYSAWSPLFEVVGPGLEPLQYKPIALVDDETGEITVKFEKL